MSTQSKSVPVSLQAARDWPAYVPQEVMEWPVVGTVMRPQQQRQNAHPALKRGFDVLFSLGVLILGLPIYLTLAVGTYLSATGPIFYTQERLGKNGKLFWLYKFRSMHVDAERGGPRLSSGLTDPRITPWGRFMRKFRLDELPQFYNVLLGDMSVVGHRPERPFYIDQLIVVAPQYAQLLQLKPGITSIGQIAYGYASTVPELVNRLQYDLLYPQHQSFLIDLWLITQTIRVMLQGRGR